MNNDLLGSLLTPQQVNTVPSVASVQSGQASAPGQVTNLGNISSQLPRYQSATQPQPTASAIPQHGNWFTRLLPTAGSILGGIGGELIDPFGGGIAGAALGSTLGKAGENAAEGQNVTSGLGGAAVEGGVGQLTGHLLGGALKLGAGAASSLADKGATGLVQGQFAKGTVDNATAQTLRDMGITDARQVAQIAPISTGTTGALSAGVKRGLTEADTGADLSNLGRTGQNLVAENQMQLNTSSIPTINKTIQGALLQSVNPEDVSQVTTKGGGTLNTFQPGSLKNVLPEDAFKVTQNFEQLANKAYQGAYDKMGNVNPDQLAKYNIFKGLADETRSATFGGDTPIPLSDTNKAQIINDLSPMNDINPQAYNWHVNQVTNANTLQDLRPIQAPMVRVNNALKTTQNIADNSGGTTAGNVVKSILPTMGGLAGGSAGAVAGVLPSLVKSSTADRAGASILSKLADAGVSPKVTKLMPKVLTGASQFISHAPEYTPSAIPNAQGAAMQPQQMQPQSPQTSELQQVYNAALLHPYMPGSMSTLQSLAPVLQNLQGAGAAINSTEQAYNAAGGAQGMAGGLLSKLGGLVTGNPVSGYEQERSQLAMELPKLGVPASAIPDVTDTSASAQAKWNIINSVLASLGNPANTGASVLGALPVAQ